MSRLLPCTGINRDELTLRRLLDLFFAVLAGFLITLSHALIDLRLFGKGSLAPNGSTTAIVCVYSVLGASVSLAACLLYRRLVRNPFWAVTLMVGVYIVASFAIGIFGALYAGLRLVTGPQYLRIMSVITAVVNMATLRPTKTW